VKPEVQEQLLDELLPGWREAAEVRGERRLLCPLHPDRNPSLRFKPADHTWYCDPCGRGGGVWDLAVAIHGEKGAQELLERISPSKRKRRRSTAPTDPPDCTLEKFADAKRLPVEFLKAHGIREQAHNKGRRLVIPYTDSGVEKPVIRYRHRLERREPDDRFFWKQGS
jgi:hypothetical protein